MRLKKAELCVKPEVESRHFVVSVFSDEKVLFKMRDEY